MSLVDEIPFKKVALFCEIVMCLFSIAIVFYGLYVGSHVNEFIRLNCSCLFEQPSYNFTQNLMNVSGGFVGR